jgi:uncharacterized membrane protein required for colicin V production
MTAELGINAADGLAIGAVLIGAIIGFKHGLSTQLVVLIALLAIGATLLNGFGPCQAWLATEFGMPAHLARIASLALLIVIPLATVLLVYALFGVLMRLTFTSWFDRVGGAIAGALTTAGVVALAFLLLNVLPSRARPVVTARESWIGRRVMGVETQLVQTLETRVKTAEDTLQKARARRTGKREKWEE